MFIKSEKSKPRKLIDGVTICPLAYGERTNLGEFRLTRGFRIPSHSHHYEQTGYLVTGKLSFRIGETWNETDPGDSWCIPAGEEHEVIILEDSVVIEVFSPVRHDYL